MHPQAVKVIPLLFDTYIRVIENSEGSRMFRNLFADVNGQKTDITRDGELSCAFFVSSVLLLFGLVKEGHATVDSTVKDMKSLGWEMINEPRIGCVVVWGPQDFGSGGIHKHIGFLTKEGECISNSFKMRCPVRHHWTYQGTRKIEAMFWNPRLNEKLWIK